MDSLKDGFAALVIGSSGGIGAALVDELDAMPRCGEVVSLSRASHPSFDLTNEASIAAIADEWKSAGRKFDLVFDATGALTIQGEGPEKSLAALNGETMAQAFAVNVIGPALLLKHFAPTLATDTKSVFASLSARVGSIGDNRLGGWYSYRASKAALNQIVKTGAIEIARKFPDAVVLALHPGTVETPLTRPFARGRFTHSPREAARNLVRVIDQAGPEQSGSFLAYDGSVIPW